MATQNCGDCGGSGVIRWRYWNEQQQRWITNEMPCCC